MEREKVWKDCVRVYVCGGRLRVKPFFCCERGVLIESVLDGCVCACVCVRVGGVGVQVQAAYCL